jgi:hypothetical protein
VAAPHSATMADTCAVSAYSPASRPPPNSPSRDSVWLDDDKSPMPPEHAWRSIDPFSILGRKVEGIN